MKPNRITSAGTKADSNTTADDTSVSQTIAKPNVMGSAFVSTDLFGNEVNTKKSFIESFIVPPFSVLNTCQPYWQKRKKFWKKMIGDMGESRKDKLSKRTDLWNDEKETYEIMSHFDTSLLDPVLSEIVNAWFGFPNCKTFDCFAGDTVFGFVSAYLGNEFTGIELRQEQANLNNVRVKGLQAKYICDDGINVLKYIEQDSQDLLFSCPPYFDLEKYSDLPNDASNQKEYKSFLKILDEAFSNSIKCLKKDRFAVIVIGDIRDGKGNYRRLPDHIKDIFEKNGMPLYNELIMLEMIGRKALTANRNFILRKCPKVHQNVLVFYKGNIQNIKKKYSKLR
jgi:tRNA1(Val) A37 N6-methylase TrmN6